MWCKDRVPGAQRKVGMQSCASVTVRKADFELLMGDRTNRTIWCCRGFSRSAAFASPLTARVGWRRLEPAAPAGVMPTGLQAGAGRGGAGSENGPAAPRRTTLLHTYDLLCCRSLPLTVCTGGSTCSGRHDHNDLMECAAALDCESRSHGCFATGRLPAASGMLMVVGLCLPAFMQFG